MALAATLDKYPKNSSGFSMIEVLITILVFAIGLLGVAAMQVQALKGTADGGQRGKAVWLAQELTERMRANPAGAENGDYILAKLNCGNAPKVCGNYYDGSSPVASVSCNSADMAAFDLWELTCGTYDPASNNDRKGSTIDFLAGADVSILCTSCASPAVPAQVTSNSDFTITISWTGRSSIDNSTSSATLQKQQVELLVRP